MAELVDAPDSKSGTGNSVRVQVSLPAPLLRARSIDSINAVDSGRARLLPDEAVMRLT